MKAHRIACLVGVLTLLSLGSAFCEATEIYREQSDLNRMMHKLGRGVTNVLTCWVEIPHNIAVQWERTDPVTGLVVGGIKGVGWTFARFATGVYDTFTFPLPVPPDYQPLMEPEFIITDVWGDPIPGITEFNSNDPDLPDDAPIYPGRFNF